MCSTLKTLTDEGEVLILHMDIERPYYIDKGANVENFMSGTFHGESGAHKFIISAFDSKETKVSVPFTGTATAYFLRSDGSTLTVNASVGDGKITAILNHDCYDVPGRFTFTIFNQANDVDTCIYACIGNVYRTRLGPLIDSGEVVPSLDDVIKRMNAVRAATDAANNAAALASSTAVAFGPYNAFDILAGCSKPTRTVSGITFSWSGNKLIVDGTFPSGGTNQSASANAFNSDNSFPFGMKPGMTIRLAADITPAWLYIAFYQNGAWSQNTYTSFVTRTVQVPSDATGVRFGVGVSNLYEQSPDYGHVEVEVAILSSDVMTNSELKNMIQHTFPFHGASDGGTIFSSDLNDLDEEGTYILEGSGEFVNSPYASPRTGGMLLIVYPVVRTYGYQPTATMHQVIIYVRENAIWVRSRSSGVWTSWGRCSLPAGPSSDGTYTLKCTVSNNALTYTWARD